MRNEDQIWINYRSPIRRRKSNSLPHWEVDDGLYFVTFRLDDSIPKAVEDALHGELERELTRIRRSKDNDLDLNAFKHEFYLTRIEPILDKGRGACWLRKPRIARMMMEALEYYDGDRYRLYAYVVMGNHVHVVFKLFRGADLGPLLRDWKGYTSKQAREILNREESTFWQAEYYDRLIRTVGEFRRTVTYTWYNPEAAGFDSWDWRRRFLGRMGDVL